MFDEESRREFDEYIRGVGIDPNDLSGSQKATYPIAFGAWQTQQLKIEEMQRRIANFKRAFSDL